MKTISTQLSHFLENKELRRNLPLLGKFVGLLMVVIVVFTVIFHFIMLYAEGEQHSWITGLYWTLTVMSTLGFGDITFHSDIGRAFSVLVLVTGIIMLLIVLPFAFIRFFYAPWLEAQIQARAPRSVPKDTRGHVIICARCVFTDTLIKRLDRESIPYFVLESDPATASNWYAEGISTVIGEVDDQETYEAVRVDQASLILANRDDIINTNIALTVRSVVPKRSGPRLVALSEYEHAEDVLELSGADEVMPIKSRLGQQLARRVDAENVKLHQVGVWEKGGMCIAELPVKYTAFAGKTIRQTRLRENTGVSIIGVWQRGPLKPAVGDQLLTDDCVLVVIGTQPQLDILREQYASRSTNPNPVVIIGGGAVGVAAARELCKLEVPFHFVERDQDRCDYLQQDVEEFLKREFKDYYKKYFDGKKFVFQGDAAEEELLKSAGIAQTPTVLLTTNDDSVNIYLASYCRNLASKHRCPELGDEVRIVSRVTHTRNVDALHRAGADFVLSYVTLATDSVMACLLEKELIELGEGVDIYVREVPTSLQNIPLSQSGIGEFTGMNVIALKEGEQTTTHPLPSAVLKPGMELLLVGSDEQIQSFIEQFG